MINKKILLPFLSVSLLFVGGCKLLNTNLTIQKRELPQSYSAAPDSANIANLDWRNYFADTFLLKLIDSAVQNNIDLQIALQRIEVSRAGVRHAKGEFFPRVDANINGGVRKFGLYTMDGAGNIVTEITPGKLIPINLPDLYVGFQASWEIDIWGKLRNQKRSAMAKYLAGIEGRNLVLSNLIADVATSYYELLALDLELEIIQQTIIKEQEALDVIKLQKESGRANELAVQQFNAQLLGTKALEKETSQKIVETENRINFLLGRYPTKIERDKDNLFSLSFPVALSGMPSDLLRHRPDIRKAEFELQATKFDLKAAKAAFFPNLNLMATFGFQAFNPELLFISPASIAYSAIGSLVAPLLNMNDLKARFRTAKAGQFTALYQYQYALLNGYTEVVNQISGIKNLEQSANLRQEQTAVLIQSVETSKELYRSAKASYLEVLLAQQNALMANLELVEVIKRQKQAHVNIYKALGGGWK